MDSISPTVVSPLGRTKVVLKGAELWAGNHVGINVHDFAPPLTVCIQGRVCELDLFESDKKKVVCYTKPEGLPMDPEEVVVTDGEDSL